MNQQQLQDMVQHLLDEARSQGATAAEAAVSIDQGTSVNVRFGEIETVEQARDHSLGVTVYVGQRKGSASTTDFSKGAIGQTVDKALTIARLASEDPFAGLADASLLAKDFPDLDLNYPWPIEVAQAAELAAACEKAALEADERICNSEGATVSTHAGSFIYGNSLGFVGGYPVTRHDLSVLVLAEDEQGMQRDYWYDSKRDFHDLASPEEIGHQAAERALQKLGARKLSTRNCPVIFRADVAGGLIRGLMGAINGHAQYRESSFLLGAVGQQIFPDWVHIHEQPHLLKGLGSAPFDGEGVATYAKDFVRDGILQTYSLNSYAARKLGLVSTGNAGGSRNLAIDSGNQDLAGLMREMGTGLIVTETMGQGLNTVTGDYSKGAAGLWVENGEVQYAVEEITIAGNLKDMFRQLLAVGNDLRHPGSIRTGSWLIENMTVAGG